MNDMKYPQCTGMLQAMAGILLADLERARETLTDDSYLAGRFDIDIKHAKEVIAKVKELLKTKDST